MTEFEQKLFIAVAKKIKNDNMSLQALTDNVMAEVRAYCDKYKKEYKALTDFEKERLTNVRYVLGEISKIKYTKEQLDSAIENNLKRIPGNLADESRREDLYNVLANLNFKCIYSDILLIGGKQSIHLDHIIPVNLGGPTDDWNILPICGSCNSSKSDSHLLDWWEKEHAPQDESKLVYIFEYMANRLLKSLNTKGVKVVTTLTDDEIRKAIELENKATQQEESKQQTIDLEEDDIEEDYEDIEEVEQVKDQKIKRLDAITFLYQMLNHIKQNKQYIISPDNLNQGLLDTLRENDKQRLIDKKFKKLEKLFNSIYKQNKRLTGVKTDIQLLDEQRKMVEYIKSLDIVSYYHISYTYFDELQQMLDQGKTDKEIQEFCNSVDRFFNVDIFIQELQDFMATHDGRYPTTASADKEEIKLGNAVSRVRQSKRGRIDFKLTEERINKLNAIGFKWDGRIEWFEPFYENIQIFIKENGRYPNSESKNKFERKLAMQVANVRQAKKNKGTTKLTEEMIDKLNKINFVWERSDWFNPFYENLKQFIEENGRYPTKNKKNSEYERKLAISIFGIRRAYKGAGRGKLTKEMIEKLNEINFIWDASKTDIDKDWFDTFCNDLKCFIDKNGRYPHINSQDEIEKKMAHRVNDIRQTKKGNADRKLTTEMIDKLEEMDFAWTAQDKPKVEPEWFGEFYKALQNFIKCEGGYPKFNSPNKEEKYIAQKVSDIRKGYKKINNGEKANIILTKGMIDKLNLIDFVWEVSKEDRYVDWFTSFCEDLQEFIKGNGRYPSKNSEDEKEKKIGQKVKDIRVTYKKLQNNEKITRRLTQDMIDALNKINFAWTAKEEKEKIALFLAEQGIEQGLSA